MALWMSVKSGGPNVRHASDVLNTPTHATPAPQTSGIFGSHSAPSLTPPHLNSKPLTHWLPGPQSSPAGAATPGFVGSHAIGSLSASFVPSQKKPAVSRYLPR